MDKTLQKIDDYIKQNMFNLSSNYIDFIEKTFKVIDEKTPLFIDFCIASFLNSEDWKMIMPIAENYRQFKYNTGPPIERRNAN